MRFAFFSLFCDPEVFCLYATHTHTRLTALFQGLPRWVSTRKEKPIWILPKQETVSGSGISWAVCKSAPHSRQITMPAPHYSFLQAGCPFCRPTNSVKALPICHISVNSVTTTLHPFNGLFYRTTWLSWYKEGKTSLDLNEARDDGVLGCNGISWTICKQSAPCCRQISTPTPHHSVL